MFCRDGRLDHIKIINGPEFLYGFAVSFGLVHSSRGVYIYFRSAFAGLQFKSIKKVKIIYLFCFLLSICLSLKSTYSNNNSNIVLLIHIYVCKYIEICIYYIHICVCVHANYIIFWKTINNGTCSKFFIYK